MSAHFVESVRNGIVGSDQPIRDAASKVTGQSRYVADRTLPGMLHAKVLFSPVAHARIRSIDLSKAEALPGVRAVLCCQNTPQTCYNSCGEEFDGIQLETVFPEIVRYVGDRVAAVAADSLKIAEQALRLIEVDYEPLPAVLTTADALKEDAYPIHSGGNISQRAEMNNGDVEQAFLESDYIFENTYTVPPIHHGAMETHSSLATYDYDGRLTIYTPSQDTFGQRMNLEKILEIPMSRIRLVAPVIGGGFGGKIDLITEPVTALLAMRTHRPVKLVFTRKEEIVSTRTRHGVTLTLKTGVSKDGTILAQDVRAVLNAGAYASATSSVVWAMGGKVFRIYRTPNQHYLGLGVYTNTPIGGAMRGFGSPQLIFAFSAQLNEIANQLGMDVTLLQAKNLVAPDGVNPLTHLRYGNPRPIDCVQKGRALIRWDEAVREQQESATANGRYRIGVGMGIGDHGSGLCFTGKLDTSAIILKMNCDGSVILYTGTHDMGNGSVTTQTQIVSEILGLTLDRVGCVQADTDASPYNYGDYASRGTYVAGHAAMNAAKKLRDLIYCQASEILAQAPEYLASRDNRIYSLLNPDLACSFGAVAIHARNQNHQELMVSETYISRNDPVSYGAHFAKVEVDTQTGQVKVLDYAAVHDVGKAMNPLSLEGQLQGGIQMGIGYALTEGLILDEAGQVKNSSFRTYPVIRTSEMPEPHLAFVEELEPTGPFGAKSIGECATVPAAPAIANAVSNALGIPFRDLPLRPERILAHIKTSPHVELP